METILPKEYDCPGIKNPLVSVIIPVYNGEKFIDACLDSIQQQTYRPIEIIVVNDGSTDTTALRAEGHGSKPVVVTTLNCHLSSARNTGIRRARGDYIAFCDVDDLWLPEKLEKQVGRLSASPDIGLVFTAVVIIGDSVDKQKKRHAGLLERKFNKGDQHAVLAQKNIIAPSSVVLRRSVLDRTGFFDESLFSCEDWDLWLRIAKNNIRMYRIGLPLTLYRRHGANMSKKIEVMHGSRMRVLEKAFEGLEETSGLLRLKNRALALAYFEAANGYYSSGDFRQFRDCYREARRYGQAWLSLKALRRFVKDRLYASRNR